MLAVGALVEGFWPLSAVLVGAGMLGSCANAATGRAVMGWFSRAERGTALGIRQMATPLGGGLAALALPALAAGGGLRAALLALAAVVLASAVASAIWIRTPPAGPGEAERAGPRRRPARSRRSPSPPGPRRCGTGASGGSVPRGR
jgi:sugar phosphate permease